MRGEGVGEGCPESITRNGRAGLLSNRPLRRRPLAHWPMSSAELNAGCIAWTRVGRHGHLRSPEAVFAHHGQSYILFARRRSASLAIVPWVPRPDNAPQRPWIRVG